MGPAEIGGDCLPWGHLNHVSEWPGLLEASGTLFTWAYWLRLLERGLMSMSKVCSKSICIKSEQQGGLKS